MNLRRFTIFQRLAMLVSVVVDRADIFKRLEFNSAIQLAKARAIH